MKRAELEAAFSCRQLGCRLIIGVAEHKTGFAESAKIVADAAEERMLVRWLKVLEEYTPDTVYLFPTIKGEKTQHLDRLISRATREVGHALPSSREVRVSVELQAKKLPSCDKERVSRSLSHSAPTAAQYYRANTQKDCNTAYDAVKSILEGEPSPTSSPSPPKVSSPSKRKRFSEEQNAAVRKHFSVNISGKTLPSKDEIEEFIRVHQEQFPGRKAHDIYSKVRNLIGRKNM